MSSASSRAFHSWTTSGSGRSNGSSGSSSWSSTIPSRLTKRLAISNASQHLFRVKRCDSSEYADGDFSGCATSFGGGHGGTSSSSSNVTNGRRGTSNSSKPQHQQPQTRNNNNKSSNSNKNNNNNNNYHPVYGVGGQHGANSATGSGGSVGAGGATVAGNGDGSASTSAGGKMKNSANTINMLHLVSSGLVSVLGLGIFVITGHVANEVAGPAIIASLIIAAVSSLLSGLCYAEFQTRQSCLGDSIYSSFYQSMGEFPAYMVGWSLVLQHVSGMAVTGRAFSALLDYNSGHKIQNFWLQRLGHSAVFSSHPDLVAFLCVLLTAMPFALGLKWPRRLSFLVSGCIFSVAVLFVAIGAKHVDSRGWSAHGFLPNESSGLLSGAAICTCAFSGHYSMVSKAKSIRRPERYIPLAVGITITICFVTYFAVATVLTLMIHHKKLDSDVPLVQAFEVRDVSWARVVIGFGDGLCLILTLLTLSYALYTSALTLASDGLIFRCLAQRCPFTKSAILPGLLFGTIAALAAIFFPLTSLLEIMALSPLLINTFVCDCVLHLRYQPDDLWRYDPLISSRKIHTASSAVSAGGGATIAALSSSSNQGTPSTNSSAPSSPASSDNCQRGRAGSSTESTPRHQHQRPDIRINKQEIFPLVKPTLVSLASLDEDDGEMTAITDDDENNDDRRHKSSREGAANRLQDLMDFEAGCTSPEVPLLEFACDPLDSDGGDDLVAMDDDSEYESSDTDIDAIVEEYKEKLRVATLTGPRLNLMRSSGGASGGFGSSDAVHYPTAATGRRVCIAVVTLSLAFFFLSLTLVLGNEALARASPVTVLALCVLLAIVVAVLVIIVRQPQNLSSGAAWRHHGGQSSSNVFRVPLLPWIPAIAAFLNICLLANTLRRQWAPFLVWALTGILIYFFYGVWNSTAANQSQRAQPTEKIKLKPIPRQPFLSSVLPIHNQGGVNSTRKITQVDTILIAR